MAGMLRKIGLVFAAAAALSACAIIHSKPYLPSRSDITPGATVTVQGNQNVYAIAREHNVSMRDLIVLNQLQPPYTLHSGQTLVLPAETSGSSMGYFGNVSGPNSGMSAGESYGAAPPPQSSPSGGIEAQALPPIQTSPIPSQSLPPPVTQNQATYTNTPSAPSSVMALNQPSAPPKPVATTVSPSGTSQPQPQPPPLPPAPSNIQAEQPSPPPAAPEAASSEPASINMVWPVQGPILSGFGPKGQGLNNDGINIGAPKGSPVVAAANGIVVYAGNQMKGFGNLILIRHQDGWVTAYAHLDRMLVTKDSVVVKGDEIGTVGKTGNVPSPQLHFETRYNGKPVDPSTVIKAQ